MKKTHLFLMEIMLAIFFFAFSGALCIELFTRAYTVSQQSDELSAALFFVQSGAEALKSTAGNEEQLLQMLPLQKQDAGEYIIQYDRDWQVQTDQSLVAYTMTVHSSLQDDLLTGEVRMLLGNGEDTNDCIYQIAVKKFLGGGVS